MIKVIVATMGQNLAADGPLEQCGQEKERPAMQTVRDVMTPNPKTCQLMHPITCALGIMREENCGAVPLVDRYDKTVGMITDRDIAMCLLENDRAPDEIKVGNCVKLGHLVAAKADEPLSEVIQRMKQSQVRRIPVVDAEMRCIGILAQADIVLQDENKQEAVEFVKEVSKTT